MSNSKKMAAIILAGGMGSRLWQMTTVVPKRPKPAVPFGSKLRLIDFAVSNAVNSDIDHTWVMTQYRGAVIQNYLGDFDYSASIYDKYVRALPPAHDDCHSYVGTANAVYQNIDWFEDDSAEVIAILAADHIYKIDLRQMLEYHKAKDSVFTVCCINQSVEEAKKFGVMTVGDDYKIQKFVEKPENPDLLPGSNDSSLVSMGVYLINKGFLIEQLRLDHDDPTSEHDFGKNIIPRLVQEKMPVYAYSFSDNKVEGEDEDAETYWRDVGDPYAYWEAQMDLVAPRPLLNLYNYDDWPIRSVNDRLPAAKDIFPDKKRWIDEFGGGDCPYVPDRIAAGGCIFDSPQRMKRMVIGRKVRTGYGFDGVDSIVFDEAQIGAHVKMYRCVIEEGVYIPDNARIGFDIEEDINNGIILGISEKDIASKEYLNMDPEKIIRFVTKNHKL